MLLGCILNGVLANVICHEVSYFIPGQSLEVASRPTTATAMARALLVSCFDMTTLLISNLKGGGSKRSGADETVRLQ